MQAVISSVGGLTSVNNYTVNEQEYTLPVAKWVADPGQGAGATGYIAQIKGSDIGENYVIDGNAEFTILPGANTLDYLKEFNKINAAFTGAESGDGADATKQAYYFYARVDKPTTALLIKIRTRKLQTVII